MKKISSLFCFGLFFIGMILFFISINDFGLMALISVVSIISGLLLLSKTA
jgi:hypothetical protein|tara:strand:+ start:196 stop:345 length:150 start_codon:yes stop_codon:yes gene_type:complete